MREWGRGEWGRGEGIGNGRNVSGSRNKGTCVAYRLAGSDVVAASPLWAAFVVSWAAARAMLKAAKVWAILAGPRPWREG